MNQKIFVGPEIRLNYAESAPNGPPLLLLHGLTFRWQSFSSLTDELTAHWHVYALDFRGHGGSEHSAKDDYHLDEFVEDTVAFLQTDIAAPTVLIGHSLGGAVALKVGAQIPDLVRAIVVVDNFLFSDSLDAVRNDPATVTLFAGIKKLVRETRNPKELEQRLSDIRLPFPIGQTIRVGDIYDQAFLENWAASIAQIDPEVISVLLGEIAVDVLDSPALLKANNYPLLLLQANPALGGLLPDRDVERARAIKPLTQHVRFDDLGHMMHLQNPKVVLLAILSFLETVR